ncbi:antibiotic biosynthesis monooxygenase family protein [Streptomyces boncukensis]|uniref:Antibiotic biosynthesis monooxygenase n=1 Tax=Streptomyces boncukensis TaxID=2711219 RepID=A0A6G4WSE2_9ACTN|nr:antibiotic biosynthesis monooxygenase [Streptomyces boncukensis]NGO67560.1 antibiotic biosynthesis monooxygenase [Streptomyces boncukensis]
MPFISPEDDLVHVFNIFETKDWEGQQRVLDAHRDIIDNADYPGWVSSTVHGGQEAPGTANLVQWRSVRALEERYAGTRFQRTTVPLFQELSTSVRLLRTEAVFGQRHPAQGEATEVSPERDDYTVIVLLDVEPGKQSELLGALAHPDEWLLTVPGYRSHTYLRGLDGSFVLNYAQWGSKEDYDRFHTLPEEERPGYVRKNRARARSLATSRWSNTFRAWHSRSAAVGAR